MAGNLNIRVDKVDAQSAILIFDSSGPSTDNQTSKSRTGGTLKIDVGRTATIRLPDFLTTDDDVEVNTDRESTEQYVERLTARIATLEKLQENHLVPADETDHFRIQNLMTALSNEREKTSSMNRLASFVEEEFRKNLDTLREDQLDEIENRHGFAGDGSESVRKGVIRAAFENSAIAKRVDLFESTRIALEEDQKREAVKNFGAAQQSDVDAKHIGDTYRGADSTTDLRMQKGPGAETVTFDDLQGQKASGSNGGQGTGKTGPEVGDNPGEDTDASHKDTQEKADQMLNSEDTLEEADGNREKSDDVQAAEEDKSTRAEQPNVPEKDSNNPERDEPNGNFPLHGGGGSTIGGKIEDRPVKFNEEGEASSVDFASKAKQLKVSQLAKVEEEFKLSGDGTKADRQDALKKAFNESGEERKANLTSSVDKALEE